MQCKHLPPSLPFSPKHVSNPAALFPTAFPSVFHHLTIVCMCRPNNAGSRSNSDTLRKPKADLTTSRVREPTMRQTCWMSCSRASGPTCSAVIQMNLKTHPERHAPTLTDNSTLFCYQTTSASLPFSSTHSLHL